MKRFFVGLAIPAALCVLLSGCGQKRAQPPAIVNWTLPDVSSFEEAYTKEAVPAEQPAETPAQPYRWNPHGVFTYVFQNRNEEGQWSTALFKVSSVDYEKHCAVLTYTVKDSRGYQLALQAGKNAQESDFFYTSDGERVAGLEEKEDADGTRHVIIYLSNEHYLEFSGRERLEESKYCYRDLTYRLKHEG